MEAENKSATQHEKFGRSALKMHQGLEIMKKLENQKLTQILTNVFSEVSKKLDSISEKVQSFFKFHAHELGGQYRKLN